MITADRFIASKAFDEDGWLRARRHGITATTIAKAMTPAGYKEVLETWHDVEPVPVNGYMQFGLDMEKALALYAKQRWAHMPNDWLIAHGDNPIALATPDGMTLGHTRILEIKTTGKDWDTPPIAYRRQIQWQLYVTGAEACDLIWMIRESVQTDEGEFFVPGWFEPKHTVIEPDPKMISDMVETADRLWGELRGVA
jgi:putative phage-type endonuclease